MAWKREPAVKRYNRDSVLTFGKYKGLSVADVLKEDPQYLMWIVKNVPEVDLDADILDEAEDVQQSDFPLDKFNLDWIDEIPF